ncbi:MAG: hypothetical protein DK306_002328 [Chloroflexi bacterium]|nr:MAG: hypothetical protein DK306_002328 [Chloroflexota bacterium]
MSPVSAPAPPTTATRILRVAGQDVPYALRRSTRARRASIHIHPRRGVEVVLPDSLPDTDAAALLTEKRAWLERHATEILRAGRRVTLAQGATLPYRGRWLRLRIAPTAHATARPEITPSHESICVALPHPTDELALRRALTDWYRARARVQLLDAVSRLHDPADERVRRLSVRDQSTCWGSCSSKGGLSFNWRLVMAPPPVLDAVVAHELVHLNQLDHSPAFWSRLDARFPRHRACRRWLDANAYRLTL